MSKEPDDFRGRPAGESCGDQVHSSSGDTYRSDDEYDQRGDQEHGSEHGEHLLPALTRPKRYGSLHERIIANTVMSDWLFDGEPCWLWMGSRNSAGYGALTYRWRRGPRKGKVGRKLVHRLAFMLFKRRKISTKSVVMHRCDVRLCCNPAHLLAGKDVDNMRDMVNKDRHRTPFRSSTSAPAGQPALTRAEAALIREPGED